MLETRVVVEPSRRDGTTSRPDPWPRMWHALCSLPLVAVVVVFCLGRAWKGPLYLEPLLAVPPALAGIGATKPRRPLIYGGISLLAALVVATRSVDRTPSLTITTVIAVIVVTAVSAAGAVLSSRRNQKLADVMNVAEVAQRALEAVHEVYTLAEVARRLDASLVRRDAVHEEFVTAVLVEVDPEVSAMTIYNCGHPSPMVLAPAGRDDPKDDGQAHRVTVVDVPLPAPPLGLMSLGDCSGASRRLPFKPGDELLLYTDGITEARDAKRRFYPLAERLAALAGTSAEGSRPDLLKRLKDDVLRHVGAPLDDDAALLRARAVGGRAANADALAEPGSQTLAPAPGTAPL